MKTFILSLLVLVFYSFGASTVNATSLVGVAAPEFTLQDQNNQARSLQDFKGKWLVLYFYPKDNTPGCTTEAKNFKRDYEKFKALNAEIVGVSLDDVESHKEFVEVTGINFPILADTEEKAAKAYNVLGGMGPLRYTKRQTFVIDPEGYVSKHYESVNAEQHSEQLLKDLPTMMTK